MGKSKRLGFFIFAIALTLFEFQNCGQVKLGPANDGSRMADGTIGGNPLTAKLLVTFSGLDVTLNAQLCVRGVRFSNSTQATVTGGNLSQAYSVGSLNLEAIDASSLQVANGTYDKAVVTLDTSCPSANGNSLSFTNASGIFQTASLLSFSFPGTYTLNQPTNQLNLDLSAFSMAYWQVFESSQIPAVTSSTSGTGNISPALTLSSGSNVTYFDLLTYDGATCQATLLSYLPSTGATCTLGGGCAANGQPPTPANPSANPSAYGVCTTLPAQPSTCNSQATCGSWAYTGWNSPDGGSVGCPRQGSNLSPVVSVPNPVTGGLCPAGSQEAIDPACTQLINVGGPTLFNSIVADKNGNCWVYCCP